VTATAKTPIAIQKADVNDGHPDDVIFDAPQWSSLIEADSAQEALTHLVALINADELDDQTYFFRVVNTETKEVL